jgi:hypothetical protein
MIEAPDAADAEGLTGVREPFRSLLRQELGPVT